MKTTLALSLALFALIVTIPSFAFDQPWNGNREDITGPCTTNCAPPPPPCPGGMCQCPNPNNTKSPVYTADGSLVWSDTDITFPVTSRISLKRTYNSFDYRAGLFGRGWVTAQESNIARTYRAVTEGNADGSPKTAAEFESVPIWLASYGRRYELQETATECATPDVLYFTFLKQTDGTLRQIFEDNENFSVYSESGLLLQEYSDEEGVVAYYEYDDQNRLVRQIDSYGFTLNFAYNDQGFVSQVTDQADRVWNYTYDEFGRLVQVLDPDGNTKDYAYQAVDNIGFQQHLLTDVNDNTDDPALRVTWGSIQVGTTTRMRVTSYTESDGHRHDYTYTSTTFNGQPAVQVVKDTKQVNSSTTIERQTFIADASNYRVLNEINNTDNLTVSRLYNDRGNVIEENDERGNVTRYEYNDTGRRTRVIELVDTDNQKEITTSYWNDTDRIAVMNEYGIRETRFTYDNKLRLLTQTQIDLSDNQQRIWTYTYHPNTTDSQGNDILGKVASIDGPQVGTQDTKTFEYNSQGLLIRINYPLSQFVSYVYNSIGQLITETDVNGIVTDMSYDSRNQLVKTAKNSRIQRYEYNSQDQLIQIVDELGRVTEYSYTLQNKPQRITYPSGDYLNFSYTYATDHTEITTQYYQSDNILISTEIIRVDADTGLNEQEYLASTSEQISAKQYNNLDDLAQETLFGQYGSSLTSTLNYTYDREGRLAQIRNGLNGIFVLIYDDFNRLIQLSDPNGGTTRYSYDAWGELSGIISPDSGSMTFLKDPSGNLINYVNANNQQVNYIYDALNRATQIDYQDNSLDTNFVYDEGQYGKDLLTSASDGSGSSQYVYDDRGLVTQISANVAGTSLNLSYSYNDASELTQIIYPSGIQTSTDYDSAGRLSNIELSDAGSVTNVLSKVVWRGDYIGSYQQGNGSVTEFLYDSSNRLIGKNFPSLNYQFNNQIDNQGQITQQTWTRSGNNNIANFQYDVLGRLIRSDDTNDNFDWLLSYDSIGNRLSSQSLDGSGSISYGYQSTTNRLANVDSQSIQLDPAGNTINDGMRQYQYNDLNRLSNLTNALDGSNAIYTYNYIGERVRKQVSGSNNIDVRFVYGLNGELLGEYNADGSRIREYIYHYQNEVSEFGQAAELIAQVESDGRLTYIHTDHLSTPRLATNLNQTVIWVWGSDAFGNALPNEDPDTDGNIIVINHRFPGQYYDVESRLFYNYFRYYDPSIGRYITSDPIGLAGGINTYFYVNNSPLITRDYDGQNPLLIKEIIKQIIKKPPVKRIPKKSPKKSPTKPDKKKGVWNCAVVACCNDNIPGNCPPDPKDHCKQGVWRDKNRATAINKAESLAKTRLGCQAKHVTVRCTGPKGENYQRGG